MINFPQKIWKTLGAPQTGAVLPAGLQKPTRGNLHELPQEPERVSWIPSNPKKYAIIQSSFSGLKACRFSSAEACRKKILRYSASEKYH